MASSYKQWSTASTSYVRSSIVAAQGGGTTQNLTTFSGHPMSLTTWYVPDSVPEFLDIGDIRAIGHSGVANTSWFEIEITSRSAEFQTVTLENSPANLNCAQFRLIRSTSTTPLVNFVDGARLTESDLDKAYRQGLFCAQEVSEDAAGVGNLASLNLTLSGTTTVTNLAVNGTLTGVDTGKVVKFDKVTTSTNVVFPNNSTFTTFLSLDYTPLFANSTLLVEVSCSSVSKTTAGAGWIGIRLDLDNVDSGTMGGAFMYQTSANDTRRPFHSKAVIDSWGTTQKTIAFKTYGAGTTASWSHQGVQSIMTVTEIAQ